MENSYRIIHLSDLHCGKERLGLKDVFTKRATGYLNYKLKRRKQFSSALKNRIPELVNNINRRDFLVITGDLTNLTYEKEFDAARNLLDPILEPGKTLIIPGNHDRYIRRDSKKDLINKYFGEFCPFTWQGRRHKPFVNQKLNDHILLTALDMAVPRPYFSSRGKIASSALRKCLETVNKDEFNGMIKIAMGHYPVWIPCEVHEGYFHQLAGRKSMMNFLKKGDFDLYLHGHIHKSWFFKPLKDQKLVSINSGGCARHSEGEWAGFHQIDIYPENKIEIKAIKPEE